MNAWFTLALTETDLNTWNDGVAHMGNSWHWGKFSEQNTLGPYQLQSGHFIVRNAATSCWSGPWLEPIILPTRQPLREIQMCDLLIVLLSCPISKAVHGRRNLFQAQASPADPLLFSSRTILSALYNVSKQTFRFFPNPRRMRTREFLLTFKLLKTAGQRSQRRAVKNIW